MSDSSILPSAVDSRLLTVGQHLRQREQHRLKLTSYSAGDYESGSAGAEIVQLLDAMAKEENLAASELVLLREDVRPYCRTSGDADLGAVGEFRGFKLAQTIASGCPCSKKFYVFVSKAGGGPSGRDSIRDVRFFVELETRSYQVLELVLDVLQFWQIFLRYHTTLGLGNFNAELRAQVLGRLTDTLFYQAVAAQLTPTPKSPDSSPSMEALQAEIGQRLEKVGFYLAERDSLQRALARYTHRTFCDPSNTNSKRDLLRIRTAETNVLSEMVHLKDSVKKWLHKHQRASELAVVDKLRPFRVAANVVNVLKHGLRGRGKDCAVIDFTALISAQAGNAPSPDDRLLDACAFVNYGGELFSLTELIEDTCQLWVLFLRYHSPLSLTDFQARLAKILSFRMGLSTYSAPLPAGLETLARVEADRRKQLDL